MVKTNMEPLFKAAYEADGEVAQFSSNSLSIFVLALYLRIDDIHEFGTNAITEGSDDKKIDICYLDMSDKRAVIAQSYLAKSWGKKSAESDKAGDLNTGMAWLLSASEDQIPQRLKAKAIELRRGIREGEITRIELFYIHNCPESKNVDDELRVVAQATRDKINAIFPSIGSELIVQYKEFGIQTIDSLYRTRDSEILVDGWIEIPNSEILKTQSEGWKAIYTTVPANWINQIHKEYGERLFSANYRDYLGQTGHKGNINSEITKTAESEPSNFWVYNNGITALTYEMYTRLGKLRIRGISIINGAQTTGAISEAKTDLIRKARVPIRFVECTQKELIDKIIRYNNTQNEIKPSDRRSNDDTQRRLKREFDNYNVKYIHRRSFLRSPRNALTAASIAPALCSFHGEPQTAYRNAREIFNDDEIYRRVFPVDISIEHIFLLRSLSIAIDKLKSELKEKVSSNTATQLEVQQYEVLRYSASKHFLFYMTGMLAEEIMGRRVANLFEWKCKKEVISPDNVSMQNAWYSVIQSLLPQVATIINQQGEASFYEVPRSIDLSKGTIQKLKPLVASLEAEYSPRFSDLRRRTTT